MRASQLAFLRQSLDMLRSTDMIVAVHMAIGSRPRFSYEQGGFLRERAAEDAWKLKVLNSFNDGLHERINRRGRLLAHIQQCAVDGKVGIVESGRDCDCVDYVHPREAIPATLLAYTMLEAETSKWADGPFSLSIVRPKEAEATPHESHDRVMEAYEDGHPHHVVSTFHG